MSLVPGVSSCSPSRHHRQQTGGPNLNGSHPPGGRGEDQFGRDFYREVLIPNPNNLHQRAGISARGISAPGPGAYPLRAAARATAETEGDWLAVARSRTVRALEALIREAGRTPDTGDEDEPRARFHLRCPRRLLALWRDVVELARRMAGAELTQGQAAEAIAAEGLSAQASSEEAWPEPSATRTAIAHI